MTAAAIAIPIALLHGAPAAAGVSFANDVMAVLSKAGCNAGVCHGNRSGRGGFKLSLRGQEPQLDLAALTRDGLARRTDPLAPDASLILLKPTLSVPHEGGRRFAPGSPEHSILREWIAAGCPPDPPGLPALTALEATPAEMVLVEPEAAVALRVVARFADGGERDVTDLAVYEPVEALAAVVSPGGRVRVTRPGETTVLVRYLGRQTPVRLALVPARETPVEEWPPPANFIDEHVLARLRKLRLRPAPLASDVVFLRRATLDLLGILPSAPEARAFAADQRPDKRRRLVDSLLERPEFAAHWALKWCDLLRVEEKVLDRKGVRALHAWLRRSFAEGKPLDRLVRELVAARGSTYREPPANFYRALREPLVRAETAAQVFLGVRLQCARCHNHPFDRWTQDDYYGWAACFAGVRYKVLENRRSDKNDGHEFDGEQIVFVAREVDLTDPRSGAIPAPRFLGAAPPSSAETSDVLEALAAWMTGPDNPLFARVQANRIWFQLMGRGLVEPVDDFRATNPPSDPALLEALAAELVAGGFDLRHLVRAIMASRTYQLAAEPNETNAFDDSGLSRAVVRRLPAEELLDAFHQVLAVPAEFRGYPDGLRAGEIPGVRAARDRERGRTDDERFLTLFGKPPRLLACECERSGDTSMAQAFQLLSGPLLHRLLTHPQNRLGSLLAPGADTGTIVEELYWTALGRPPGGEEAEAARRHVEEAGDRRAALEDVVWALLNSKGFLFRS